ncbi:ABC transporter permease [Leptospira ryugenii]|uniref:ABC transporter permease n=1 Tax=Leptospira ryugenii TaxID=1917863 RepID=A0A2P2DYI9_9LEPT|nr:MFS transporter [Leptospira ryugenii]GBF49708.1 ABC transporter permease [Leptospira ryugenii]
MQADSKKTKLVLFLIVFSDMMGFSLLFPLFPKTITHFLYSGNDPIFLLIHRWAQWLGEGGDPKFTLVLFGGILGSLYSLLQFVSAPIWGKLSDRYGRKKILSLTTIGAVFGYILWLFSSQFWLFVLSRVITGCMGGNISVASAAMADHTDEKSRAAGMGLIGAGIGLGFVTGPLLGGISSTWTFLDSYFQSGYLVIFPASALLAVVVALLNYLFIQVYLPESQPKNRNGEMIHPFLAMRRLESKHLIRICLLNLLFLTSFSGFEFVLNFHLSELFGFPPKQIGFTFLFIGIIIIFVQGGLLRKISGKVKEKKIVFYGIVSVFVGLCLLVSMPNVALYFVALFFMAFGAALVNPGLSSFASLQSRAEEQGLALGLFRSFGSLARGLSPILFSILFFQKGPQFTYSVSLVLLLFFWILLLSTKEKETKA